MSPSLATAAGVLILSAAGASGAVPELGEAPYGLSWRLEAYAEPGVPLPVEAPAANPRLRVEIAAGVLRILDGGSQRGDLLTAAKAWCADPEAGASCRARVRVLSCQGLAGVMLGFSDGIHEDILTLHEDRIELYRAKLAHPMVTTEAFHEYRVDIRGTDVTVRVDGRGVIEGAGAFTFPAHEGRNRFSFGSGASAATGESLWQWVAWTDGAEMARRRAPVLAGAEHAVIYKEAGVYASFPTLRWSPDRAAVYASFSKKTRRTHYETLDATRGIFASRDGGRSWQAVDTLPEDSEGPRPAEAFPGGGEVRIRIGQNWRKYHPPEKRPEYEGRYRITEPGTYKPGWFAVTSGAFVARSEDGGRTWATAPVPQLDCYVSCSSPWSFIQLRDGRVLRAFMACAGPEDSGDVMACFSRDGRSADVVRVMGDPDEKLRFTEETLVHETPEGVLWMLTRVEGGDDHLRQAVSRDGGRTWTASRTGIQGHPPSGLVRLDDGRLVLTYGYRHPPYGIRAVLSHDQGLTWDTASPIILRNDGAGYDLGYPRSMALPDGTILTVYYFATEDDRISHIACTRWRPPPRP
ncbi:MAG: exo-alpha-sialidase [Lentisphaeria bacterium]|nr:exo-alpha-sialidase [Lentisphaeria bacterium]